MTIKIWPFGLLELKVENWALFLGCTSSQQCGKGEGDCDTDADCAGNLKCGDGKNGFDNNCDTSLGFPSSYDCCFDPAGGKQ